MEKKEKLKEDIYKPVSNISLNFVFAFALLYDVKCATKKHEVSQWSSTMLWWNSEPKFTEYMKSIRLKLNYYASKSSISFSNNCNDMQVHKSIPFSRLMKKTWFLKPARRSPENYKKILVIRACRSGTHFSHFIKTTLLLTG